MEQAVSSEIRRFVAASPENRFPGEEKPLFDPPLIGCAAADDPLFAEYRAIIGDVHLSPEDFLAGARSVLVWILPITRESRESNRRETLLPSREWAFTRFYGEKVNAALRRHLVAWLEERGHMAVAPQFSEKWREYADTPVGIASAWSERHAAYAAGLGTFSLSDGLITPRGVAHRVGSVITDLSLPPTPRTAPDHRHHCLWFREGSCGLCVARCPVGAITREHGHDKSLCREMVYGTSPRETAERYGIPQTGCGLCQTRVPCEGGIPLGGRLPRKTDGGP